MMGRRAAILVLPSPLFRWLRWPCWFALGSVACTPLLGDFTLVGEGDAGSKAGASSGDAAGVDAGAGSTNAVVQARAQDVSVYVGQIATVDASGSTTTTGTPTFAWSLVSAPPGSGVTAASLAGAASSRASFAPDVSGEYVLQVTVLAPGGGDTARSKVDAAPARVLFAQGNAVDGGGAVVAPSTIYSLADIDGGNARSVLCPGVVGDASAPTAQYAAYGGRAYDFWEGPPGQPSKFVAFTVDSLPEGGLTTHLWAGTSASSCDAGVIDFGTDGFGPGRPFGSEPHFNPSGSRFVVFDRQWRIVTYPADATGATAAPQIIAGYPVPSGQARSVLDPSGVDTSSGYILEPPRVEWSASGLAWAQPTANGWEIVTAQDVPAAPDAGPPTPYMTCKGVTPREIAMLDDGTVIASYRPTPQSSENLYQLKPNAQQTCTREQQYTNLSSAEGAAATDFAVSPDGTQIAFLQIDPGTQDASAWTQGSSQLPGGYVYVVPVTGGTPRQVSPDPALYGPRWIGGGAALVFTRLDGVAGNVGRLATSVVVVSPDGGGDHVVAQGDGVSTFVSTSGNAACSVVGSERLGRGSGGAGAALWFGLAVGGTLRRRRGRR
jgi:hypothetical protein